MKNRIISLTVALVLAMSAFAVSFETDRTWYLAGEAMKVSVTADDALIVYAELCDMNRLAAGTVIRLRGHHGEGIVELPSHLHSGYYMLSVYARHHTQASSRLVAIVNPLRKSPEDDIRWEPSEEGSKSEELRTKSEELRIKSEELRTKSEELRIKSEELRIKSYDYPAADFSRPESNHNSSLLILNSQVKETEGHIIQARVQNVYDGHAFKGSQIRPSISIIGKQIHYFEGKMVNDSIAVFYTFGIHGKLPLVLSAASSTGVSLPIEMMSPFATLLPKELPHLVFHYNRSEVEARSLDMQRHQIAITPAKRELQLGESDDANAEDVVPLDYDDSVFGTRPELSYNLDEYRQFLTVREVLFEYVNCVRSRKTDGVPQLFVRKEQEHFNSSWPAMVLIDDMPVIDIERLLNYDARRIHYINIYGGQYTFGNGIYNGILSFVTRSGQLTNYPIEPNAQYLVYEFPQ